MKATKKEYQHFIKENFPGLLIRKPLYYSWSNGLRFNLQVGKTNTDEYFEEVAKRSSALFESTFAKDESLFMVLLDYKYKRRKIRFTNYVFKQVEGFNKLDVLFLKSTRLYDSHNRFDIRNVAVMKLTVDKLNYRNIIRAIGNSDFPPRKPRLDNNGIFTDKEIYFLSIERKIIFHMYDDRGLDIIASNKEELRPIYLKHNDWILDYDRKDIDEQFNKKGI